MSSTQPTPIGGALSATLLPSLLRTVVPLIYAMLVRWGVTSWLDPDDLFITNLVTILVTAGFYVVLRLAERYKSQLGWLLGYAQQPVYVPGKVISVTDEVTPPITTTQVESVTEATTDDELPFEEDAR